MGSKHSSNEPFVEQVHQANTLRVEIHRSQGLTPRRGYPFLQAEPLPWYSRYTKTELIIATLVFGIGGGYLLGHVVLWLTR